MKCIKSGLSRENFPLPCCLQGVASYVPMPPNITQIVKRCTTCVYNLTPLTIKVINIKARLSQTLLRKISHASSINLFSHDIMLLHSKLVVKCPLSVSFHINRAKIRKLVIAQNDSTAFLQPI